VKTERASWRCALVAALLTTSIYAEAHGASERERLPVVGQAPDFELIDQDGSLFSLAKLHGQVVVVTFIYTTCTDTCPLLTAKLASLQTPLASDLAHGLHFVSITVNPATDTPAVLRSYAKAQGANLTNWSFLTGPPVAIDDVIRSYGAYAGRSNQGVDHLLLTSLIDRKGQIRVQYLGYLFETDEMLRDIWSLLHE
jgi:protein SCO1/2